MSDFGSLGKLFLILGGIFLMIGALFVAFKNVPFLGKLPGDIVIEKKNFTFYFPIATSVLVSIILSVIFYFISRK